MNEAYQIVVGSLPDYDQLVAEIYINGQFVALLSQEAGPDTTMLEIAGTGHASVDLATFEAALAEAKKRLWDVRRIPSSSS